jgi:hypothetical protein
MLLSLTSNLYDLVYLGPFLAVSLFVIIGLLQLQKHNYCKMWHRKYWIRSETSGYSDVKEDIVCKKCGNHFMK